MNNEFDKAIEKEFTLKTLHNQLELDKENALLKQKVEQLEEIISDYNNKEIQMQKIFDFFIYMIDEITLENETNNVNHENFKKLRDLLINKNESTFHEFDNYYFLEKVFLIVQKFKKPKLKNKRV